MRVFKKIVIIAMIMALVSAFVPAAYAKSDKSTKKEETETANSADLSEEMQTLVDLGLIRGTGKDGVTLEYTKSKPTRIQGLIIYLRLTGDAQECEEFAWQGADNFDDHADYSSYVQKVMAYAKAHPEHNWVGSNGKFSPLAHITAKQYAKIMLTALGYVYDEDFYWKNVESFAEALGLDIPKGAFTFEELAQMTYQTLYMKMKDSDQTLIAYLHLGDGTETDTTSPTVTDVVLSTRYTADPVVNGKVTVYFSEAMDVDTLSGLANYSVDLDGSNTVYTDTLLSEMTGAAATVAADKTSVTLTVPGDALAGGTAAGAGVTEITFSGLKDLAGNVIVPVSEFVRVSDVLTVVSSAAIDVDKLQVTFNNPMQEIAPAEFVLYRENGTTQAARGISYVIDASEKIVTITLDSALTVDAKADASDSTTAKIVIGTANTKDIFGNSVSGAIASTPATVEILDQIIPSIVTAETQDLDGNGHLDAVKLTFSERVMDTSVNAADFDVAGYTGEAFVPATAGDLANDDVIYITFAESTSADTGATPAVTYVQGTLANMSANKLASSGAIIATDKAAPVVMAALPVGSLTAAEEAVSATLVLSENITEANKTAVLAAVSASIMPIDSSGEISWSCDWTTDQLLTVSITANYNGGVDSDYITLTAATADLIDAAGNTTAAAQIIA